MATIVEQIFPNINNLACGTVGMRMYYDNTITGMTFPTKCRVLDIGEFKETVDIEAGVVDLDNVDITVAEDYDAHAEGFWYKLLSENPDLEDGTAKTIELLFTITEGASETFLFRGSIFRENNKAPEFYLDNLSGSPTSWVRGMEFKLVSSINVLKNVPISTLCTEVLTHAITKKLGGATGSTFDYVTFKSVIASIVSLGYNVTYNENLVVCNSADIQVYDETSSTWISPIDSYLPADYFRDPSGANGRYLLRFSNAYDVLKHICEQFALVPRYSFGGEDISHVYNELIDNVTPANNKPRLILESRGRSGGTITMTSKFLESSVILDTPRKSRRIKVSETFTSTNGVYYNNGILNSGDPPSYLDFDISIQVDHEFRIGLPGAFSYGLLYTYDGANYMQSVITGRYWDYESGAYVERNQTTAFGLASCLGEYLYHRFANGRWQYERTYGGLKANNSSTDSQRWLRTMKQHTINDGISSRTFYASEVSKNILENKSKVVWVEV